jgi:P22 coat protein - gene protein 5
MHVANSFTKQELVNFDKVIEGFDDMLVIGKAAEKYTPGTALEMDRARDQFWLPAPMIGSSYDGSDATGHFGDATQTNVPVNVSNWKHAAKAFTATDLRNDFAIDQWMTSAKQKLASDVNLSVFNTVALQGSVFSKRTGVAAGYDDVAELDALMTEVGVPAGDRHAFYESRTMNSMAGNLAARATDNKRDQGAYAKALVDSDIAGFSVYKNDLNVRLTAATGGAILINGANQRTVPAATVASGTDTVNKDNRYTDLAVDGGTYANIKIGDAFTIAGVNAIHLITKQDTGRLKTFRVISKPSANVIRVYPAIIDAAEGSAASIEYANVSATPADNAALTWLNTTVGPMNPFFVKGSVLLVPGTFEIENGSGVISTTATTELGLQITYTKQTSVTTLLSSCRFDIRWGTSLLNPEMAGCQMFSQA